MYELAAQTVHFHLPWWVWLLYVAGFAFGVTATWLPLRAGVRALRAMEF